MAKRRTLYYETSIGWLVPIQVRRRIKREAPLGDEFECEVIRTVGAFYKGYVFQSTVWGIVHSPRYRGFHTYVTRASTEDLPK